MFRRRYKQHDHVIFFSVCFVSFFVLFVFKERKEEEKKKYATLNMPMMKNDTLNIPVRKYGVVKNHG